MTNDQGQILNQERNEARNQEGDNGGGQPTCSQVAGSVVSMGAIEINSSTSANQESMAPVNSSPEDPDQSIETLQQPNSSSTAVDSQLITRGSDPQNNDQQENDQKKLYQLKRYKDLSIVGALFSTLGLIAGVAMTATQFPVGMISVVAVPFLIAVPVGLLTLSLRILSLTNKNYQQQLSKCQANQQANQQNNARSPDNQRQSQNELSGGLLSESRDLAMPSVGDGSRTASPRLLSLESGARPLRAGSSRVQ